jgi:hypothetical protein
MEPKAKPSNPLQWWSQLWCAGQGFCLANKSVPQEQERKGLQGGRDLLPQNLEASKGPRSAEACRISLEEGSKGSPNPLLTTSLWKLNSNQLE